MSRYKFQLQPAGSLPRNIDMRVALPDAVQPVTVEAPVTVEEPVVPPAFCGWEVTALSGSFMPGPFRVHEDTPYWTIGYNDEAFEFLITPICAPSGPLTWTLEDFPSGLPDLALVPEASPVGAVRLIHTPHSTTYADSFIQLTAILGVEQWGVPIYFAEGGMTLVIPMWTVSCIETELSIAPQSIAQNDTPEAIPFPPTYFGFSITYNGPLADGENIAFSLSGDTTSIDIYDVFPTDGHVRACVVTVLVYSDPSLIGNAFQVDASFPISGTLMPSIPFTCEATHTPNEFVDGVFWVGRYNSGGGSETPGDSYPANDSTTINLIGVRGYVWDEGPNGLSAVVTQLSGPARTLTVSVNGGYVFRVERTSADYTGTSFEIQFYADSGATVFGDPVLLACEV